MQKFLVSLLTFAFFLLTLPTHSPAAFGPRRGLSASASSITGAGPEIPPSFRTRQKCTIMSTEATIGILRDPSELSLVWLTFLACFDVVFLTAAWMVGEYLLEE